MPDRPTIVGHRGAAALAPENTLASLDRAVRDGADAVEFDVRLTADGRPVLLHDSTLDRTTDGTGPVRSRTFEALQALDAGRWFDERFRGERLPSLEAALDRLPARIHAYVELKAASSRDEALLDVALAALTAAGREGRATVSSSAWELIARPRSAWRSFRRALVFSSRANRDAVAFAIEHGIEEAHPNWRRLDGSFRRRARRAGLALRPYTVNGGEALDAALRHRVDSVITDDPAAMRRLLEAGDRP